VTLLKAAPEVSKDPLYQREERSNNLLRWDVEVAPGMTGEKALPIQYTFKVEMERQMSFGTIFTK
jgi:hypothetical protein